MTCTLGLGHMQDCDRSHPLAVGQHRVSTITWDARLARVSRCHDAVVATGITPCCYPPMLMLINMHMLSPSSSVSFPSKYYSVDPAPAHPLDEKDNKETAKKGKVRHGARDGNMECGAGCCVWYARVWHAHRRPLCMSVRWSRMSPRSKPSL